jgi:hypothetical protein
MRDDELLELVDQLDPARSMEPPAPGSSRYTAITEKAMSSNTTLIQQPAPETDTTTPAPRSRRPLRRWRYVAAAAAVVVVAVGTGVLRPDNERSAEATLLAAADELAEVASLRADMHFDNVTFGVGDVTIAVSGHDYDSAWEASTDGGAAESQRFVVVDGVEYHTDSTGQTTVQPVDSYMDDEGGSFAESSAAILAAVLEDADADVDEIGNQERQGVETTHYRVELADVGGSALAALPDQQLDWFGLIIGDGGLDRDVTVDIWVADGLVRRFDISSPDYGSQSVEFDDFNSDITVIPPPGPYAEPSPG